MRKNKSQEQKEIVKALVLVLQISITMIVPIILGTGVAMVIGAWLKMPWISIIGFFVGAIAGFQNVYRLVKGFIEDEK